MFENQKKNQLLVILSILILNFIMRLPSIPHAKGFDSFFIQGLANLINKSGEAGWFINWLSYFGFYPYSYSSALPFSISAFSQLTGLIGIEMEKAILLFSIVLGLFSFFCAYSFAGCIYNGFLFKSLFSLVFSTSQGVLVFTTWEVSSRVFFIVFFPLFLFILMSKINNINKIILLSVIFVFIASSHNYFWFLLPVIFVFLVLKLSYILGKKYSVSINGKHSSIVYMLIVTSAFLIPFFSGFMIQAGSRYGWITDALVISIRFVGPLFLLIVPGFVYLAFKSKTFEEWFILITFVLFLPFFYNQTYGVYLMLIFFIFFISVSLRIAFLNTARYQKFSVFIIILLLFSISFSSYYNHNRTGGFAGYNWYMPDSTYFAGVWTSEHLSEDSRGFGIGESNRVYASSGGYPIMPLGGPLDLANGFVNTSDIVITKRSPTNLGFYFDSPYYDSNLLNLPGKIRWILENDIDYRGVTPILERYNLSYYVMSASHYSKGTQSIRLKKESIYDNGQLSIWLI
ncbi:MAG: hypothetical protein QCI00_06495 [Candidatus Thermoplasmatota archaeon]|nr:hypothetical protein [Candidatus Thermoplasmatota archaeon]